MMKKLLFAALFVLTTVIAPVSVQGHPASEMSTGEMVDSVKGVAEDAQELEGKVGELKGQLKNLRKNFSLKGQLGKIDAQLNADGIDALTQDLNVGKIMEKTNFDALNIANGEIEKALKQELGAEQYKEKIQEWGKSTINPGAFKKQVKNYNTILKGIEGDNLKKTTKGIGKYLKSAKSAYSKVTNVQDSMQGISGRFKDLEKTAKQFGNKDLGEMMKSEAMQDMMPSSITNTQERAQQMLGDVQDIKQQVKNLPDRAAREKAQVQAMAQKLFTVPEPGQDSTAQCRDASDVQSELRQAQDNAQGVGLNTGSINTSLLSKAEQLCRSGSANLGGETLQYNPDKITKQATEKATSFEYIRKGVSQTMASEYSAPSSPAKTANEKEMMQNERNRLLAMAQRIRMKLVNDKKGSFARHAFEMAQKAPKRGIRHSLQSMAHAQFISMHQGGLDLTLLNARFEQLAREVSR